MPRGRNELQRRVVGHRAASFLIQSPQQLHRLQQWIRVEVGAKGERLQERRRKFSEVAVAVREEIKVTIVQRAHQSLALFDGRLQLIGGHILEDSLPQLAIADAGVEHEIPDVAEQKDLFVSGFGDRQSEFIQVSARAGIGLGKAAIVKVHNFVGNLFNRLAQKGGQDWIAALGRQALQRLTGGPPAELRQKLQPVGINLREVPSCRAQDAQKVEFLQLRYDRLGSVCRRPLSKPCERCTAKRFFSNQEGIELRQPLVSK